MIVVPVLPTPIYDCTTQPGQYPVPVLNDTDMLYDRLTVEPGATMTELLPPFTDTPV